MAARFQPRRNDAGFLLSETLAVFAISAFVLVALASIAPLLLRSLDRSVARLQNVEDLDRTISLLSHDISGLFRARWDGVEPQPFVFRGGRNSLYFAHRNHAPGREPSVTVVALREIVVGNDTNLVRSEALLPASAISFDDLQFGPQRRLGTGAARIRFSYLPAKRDGITGLTQKSWPMGRSLPDAVVIEAVDPQTTRVIVSAHVPIRANAEIGCLRDQQSDDAAPAAPGAPATANAAAATSPTAFGTSAPGGTPIGTSPTGAATQPPGQAAVPNAAGVAQTSSAFCSRMAAAGNDASPPGTVAR